MEKTNWLDHISLLLKATLTIVTAVHKERRPVVVHCSDGWDRTTQLVALAELILDPYYRTIEVRSQALTPDQLWAQLKRLIKCALDCMMESHLFDPKLVSSQTPMPRRFSVHS